MNNAIKTGSVITGILAIGIMAGRYSAELWPASNDPAPSAQVSINTNADHETSLVVKPLEVQANQKPTTPKASVAKQNFLQLGDTGIDGGLTFVLQEWGQADSLPSSWSGVLQPREGGKFVWVKIKFENNSMQSVDIHCSFDLGSKLFDKSGRKFDHIDSMYKISGNTGCNDNIQPGFGSTETIAFEMPVKFQPSYVMIWDPNEPMDKRTDSFGERSAVYFKLQ